MGLRPAEGVGIQSRAAAWCARRLLSVYPTRLRHFIEDETVETILRRLADVRRQRGVLAAQLWVLREFWSLTVAGFEARRELAAGLRLTAPGRQGIAIDLWFDDLAFDARMTLRMLRRRPWGTALCVLLLGLGVGVASSTFDVVQELEQHIVPFQDPEALVQLWTTRGVGGRRGLAYDAEVLEIADVSESFEAVSALWMVSGRVLGGPRPVHADVARVSAGFFDLLGVAPALGRAFVAGEDRPGAPWVAVLSHDFWTQELGADPGIIGRELTVGWPRMKVVGVLPEGFRFQIPDQLGDYGPPDVWIPWWHTGREDGPSTAGSLAVIARLKSGVLLRDASAELAALEVGPKWTIESLRDAWREPIEPTLFALLGAAAVTVGLSLVNILLLLRTFHGDAESTVPVRLSLGGSRARVGRLRVMEGLALALAALVVAASVGRLYVSGLRAMVPAEVMSQGSFGTTGASLTMVVMSLVCGLAVGFAGWLASPSTAPVQQPRARALRQWGLGGERALVAVQTALSVALIVGSVLFYRTHRALSGVELGFEPARRIAFSLYLMDDYPTLEQRTAFHARLRHRLESIPGVRVASGTTALPLSHGLPTVPVTLSGDTAAPAREASRIVVQPGYFEAAGIVLTAGRDFRMSDDAAATAVTIVDQSIVRDWLPSEAGVGQRIWVGGVERTIVGVVAQPRQGQLRDAGQAQVYEPYAQTQAGRVRIVVEVQGEPESTWEDVQSAVMAEDPLVPIADFTSLEDIVRSATARERFAARFLGLFALLAVTLVALGLSATLTYGVRRRASEIAVRLSLGAGSDRVIGLVLGHALKVAAPGMVVGGLIALGVGWASREMLLGISPVDAGALATALSIVTLAVLGGSISPALRAASVDPARTLRDE